VGAANGETTLDRSGSIWTDNSTGETGFKIERSTNGTKFSQVATVGAGATGYSNTGLRGGGRKYYYRVRAYNSAGNSAYSKTASATAAK
jgi:titin